VMTACVVCAGGAGFELTSSWHLPGCNRDRRLPVSYSEVTIANNLS
jgi:hypothetical protein